MPKLAPRPTYKKSRSPNGRHWPAASTCPWKGDDIPNQRIVAADWDSIKEAVNGFTAAEVAAGAVVWVKPGALVGFGAASGDVAAVEGIGNSAWTRSVLIYPLSGWGTVTSSTGMRIHRASRIALFGIKSSAAIVWTSFDHVQLGWSKYVQGPNMNTSGKYYEFWEIVNGGVRSDEDVSAVRPSGTNTIRYGKHFGCLFQPAIKAAGSGSHLDTHQSERTGTGGQFGDFEFEDSTYYSSSNGAFITSNTNGMIWRNCSIIALEIWQRVYPLQTGDYKTPEGKSKPNAINGGATNVDLYDTDVIGSIGSVNFRHLENARVHYPVANSQQASDGTRWIIAPEMEQWTREYMISLAPLPTDEYLASIWGDEGADIPGIPDDTAKPVISGFTYPVAGQTLSGTETVKINATDDTGVTRAVLSSAGTNIGDMLRGSGNEWVLPVNTAAFPNGSYPLTGIGYDAAGNVSTPVTINVVVNNSGTAPINQKPTSVLTAPSSEISRVAPTVWRGRATDDQYVALTEFFAVTPTGNVKLGEGSSVGATAYEKSIPGATIVSLAPTITAGFMRATDTGGLSTDSAKVPVTLAPIIDPSLPPTFTVTAEAITATSIRSTISLEPDPARAVQWFIDDEPFGEPWTSVNTRTFTGLDTAYGKTVRAEVTGANNQTRRSTNTATTAAGNEGIDGPVDVWGFLTDFRLISLATRQVRLRFVPSGPGVDAARLLSKAPIEAVVAADGAFTCALYPTLTVSPEVWYTPEISYLSAGQASAYERLPWKLRVPRAGGRIGDLLLAPAPPGVIAVGMGEPDRDYPAYIDLLTAIYYKNGVRQ